MQKAGETGRSTAESADTADTRGPAQPLPETDTKPQATDLTAPRLPTQPIMTGYVSAMCLNLRRGPGLQATVIGHLFRGDPVDIYQRSQFSGSTWYRVMDAAGFLEGWVAGRFVSGQKIESDFIIPQDYKAPVTPSVVTGISAQYVGARACKACHSRPHGEFNLGEWGVWREHYHSEAYKTLTKSYTRAFARKRGVGDPLTDWRCRKCHVTAYGVAAERLGPNYRDEEGVTCEACHGPGGEYLMNHWPGTPGYASRQAMGFRIIRNLQERDTFCRSCHNPLSPTYKPFNVEAFSEAIRHWPKDDFNEFARLQRTRLPESEQVAKVRPQPIARGLRVGQPAANPRVASRPIARPANGAQAATDPRLAGAPRQVILNQNGKTRGKVFFPHFAHHKYVKVENEPENCVICHHTTRPGQRPVPCGDCHKLQPTFEAPSRERAFHGTCRACHRELGRGPRKCSECHKST